MSAALGNIESFFNASTVMATVPLLQNIYHGFILLGENVRTTLQIQLGDIARLDEQRQNCMQFLDYVQQVCYYSHHAILAC